MKTLRFCCALLVFILMARSASATFESRERTVAVQNKFHYLTNEFTLLGAFFPLDAYVKSASIGAAYTYHFTDELSIEFVNFQWLFGIDTSLKQDLMDQWGVRPTEIPELRMVASSNVNYNLFYAKSALFNRYVLAPRIKPGGPALAALRATSMIDVALGAVAVALVSAFALLDPA